MPSYGLQAASRQLIEKSLQHYINGVLLMSGEHDLNKHLKHMPKIILYINILINIFDTFWFQRTFGYCNNMWNILSTK